MNYLISGGGTGGHIFPAVSIANALKELDSQANILFVGALGRMEMERVPQAGYRIVGLPVQGFNRKQPWKNVRVVINMLRSMRMVKGIIRDFRPDVGIGVGGYASGAAMKQAAKMGVPILLQEQNGFAGVTNKLLKDDAAVICVAYEGMERFFPKEKIILTGNPVRQNLLGGSRSEAFDYFRKEHQIAFDPARKTVLIIGGSLGARTINEAVMQGLPQLDSLNVIWQTGKNYYDDCAAQLDQRPAQQRTSTVCITPFLARMDLAYAAADVVISRAGASSISELCLLGKPAILVPSPNVAEDHQTHNAMALVRKDAAILVRDSEASRTLIPTLLQTINDDQRCTDLHNHILSLAQPDSARRIAEQVISLAQHNKQQNK